MLVLVQYLGRQTDGPVGVASNGAVFDADLHRRLRVAVIRTGLDYCTMQRGSRVIDTPPVEADHGGGGGGWAWLLTARGIIEAELVRGVLESAGVLPVALDGRDPSPGAWMFLAGNVNALVKVFVPASQLDSARLVLLEAGLMSAEQPEPPAARQDRAMIGTRSIWLVVTAIVVIIFLVATMHARVG